MKNLSFILFIITLCFAPLAFGTVEHWSLTIVELLICCSTVLYLFSQQAKKKDLLKVPGLLPLILLLFWMVLQIIPLPVPIVKLLSPATYEVYRPVIELSGSNFIPLSVNQKGTLNELLRIGSYTLFFFLTVQLLSKNEKLQSTVKIIIWLAIGIAFVTILQKLSSPDKIYWFRPSPAHTTTMGPWISRSQYCGFMELLGPLVLALFFYYRPTVRYSETMRMKVVSFFTMPGSNYHLLLGAGLVLVYVSVFLSLSRGGIISLCLASMLFMALTSIKRNDRSMLVATFLVSCVILAVAWFGWEPIISRFDSTFTVTGEIEEGRFDIWRDTFILIKDFIGTGSGFGTYINIFPSYKTIPGDKIYDHAHNDYLELLTDGGLVGFFLASWFVLVIILQAWKMIRKRRDNYSILIGIGAISGIAGMLSHSVTDFIMHNGADGLYFFFLCGLVVSAGHTRIHYRSRPTLLNEAPPIHKSLMLFVAVLFLFSTAVIQGGESLARQRYETVQNIYLNKHLKRERLDEVKGAVVKAAKYDPLEGLYPALLGKVEIYSNNYEQSLMHFLQAAERDPLNGVYLQQIGLLHAKKDKYLADEFMELGYERALKKDDYMLALVEWYLANDERTLAIKVLRDRILVNQQLLNMATPLLDRYSFSRGNIARILPHSTRAWSNYGHFLKNVMGNMDDAEFYFRGALDFLENEEDIRPHYFDQLYGLYRKQKKDGKALEIIRKGIKYLPDHAPFHVRLGDYYMQHDIFYRAEEEYKQALLMEPANAHFQRKLERLMEKIQ